MTDLLPNGRQPLAEANLSNARLYGDGTCEPISYNEEGEVILNLSGWTMYAPGSIKVDPIELLRKYIEHVGACEGTTFINQVNEGSDVQFSESEVTALRQLEG